MTKYAWHMEHIVRNKPTFMNLFFEMIFCPVRKWASKMWLMWDAPYLHKEIFLVKQHCDRDMSANPDLQSAVRRIGQTPCSLNLRKCKVAGTTELLFGFRTASHKLYLKFHQLYAECKTRKVSSYNHLSTIHQLGVVQHKPFMLERKKKHLLRLFIVITYKLSCNCCVIP